MHIVPRLSKPAQRGMMPGTRTALHMDLKQGVVSDRIIELKYDIELGLPYYYPKNSGASSLSNVMELPLLKLIFQAARYSMTGILWNLCLETHHTEALEAG